MMSCELNAHILRYLEIVEGGEFRACQDQKLLCAYVRRCFETEDLRTDGEQLEKYLSLARYFPFEAVFPWESFIFALHLFNNRTDGLPRWPDAFVMLGRGAGKDGCIALESMCLLSPYNGIRSYDVDICANNEEQAMRPVFDVVDALAAPKHTQKLKRHFYWTKEQVTGLKTRSVMKGRTNSPKGKDGLRSGVCIFNEIHQYENYANINVFTTGLGKKKHPRRTYYTTNGDIRGGPLDDLLERADGILRRGEPDGGLLPFLCRLDSKEEVHDEENWQKANPSLPYRPDLMEELRKEYLEWKQKPGQLTAFMTKRMNLPQSDSDVAVTDWENIKATKRDFPDLRGWQCTVGIDYASIRDWASVNAHFKRGDERFDVSHSWVCIRNPDLGRVKAPWQDWAEVTPVDDVEIPPELLAEYIAQLGQRCIIRKIAVDNFRYALVKRALAGIGFDAADRRNVRLIRPSDIIKVQPVIDSCFSRKLFTWGDTPSLRWAANNTKLVRLGTQLGTGTRSGKREGAGTQSGKRENTDTGNFYYAKIEGRSRKTDPFMALVASMVIEDDILEEIPSDFTLGVIT